MYPQDCETLVVLPFETRVGLELGRLGELPAEHGARLARALRL